MGQQGALATPRNICAGILGSEHLWAVGAMDGLVIRTGSSASARGPRQGRLMGQQSGFK